MALRMRLPCGVFRHLPLQPVGQFRILTIDFPYRDGRGGGAGLHPFVHARLGWLWRWCDEADETAEVNPNVLAKTESNTNETAGNPDEGEGELCPSAFKAA